MLQSAPRAHRIYTCCSRRDGRSASNKRCFARRRTRFAELLYSPGLLLSFRGNRRASGGRGHCTRGRCMPRADPKGFRSILTARLPDGTHISGQKCRGSLRLYERRRGQGRHLRMLRLPRRCVMLAVEP